MWCGQLELNADLYLLHLLKGLMQMRKFILKSCPIGYAKGGGTAVSRFLLLIPNSGVFLTNPSGGSVAPTRELIPEVGNSNLIDDRLECRILVDVSGGRLFWRGLPRLFFLHW